LVKNPRNKSGKDNYHMKVCKLGTPKRNSYSTEIKINGDSQHGHNHLGGIGFKVKSKPLGNWIREEGTLGCENQLKVDFDDVGNDSAGLLLIPLDVPA
jgi:hypothetical protein